VALFLRTAAVSAYAGPAVSAVSAPWNNKRRFKTRVTGVTPSYSCLRGLTLRSRNNMPSISLTATFTEGIFISGFAVAGTTIVAPNATVGCNLQKPVTLTLDEPAPDEVDITLKSAEPDRLRISKAPDQAGAASVVIRVRQGYRESPEF
jgi:hypothetical protein